MYQGNFSNWVNSKNQLIPDLRPALHRRQPRGSGFTRTVFPGNIIPQSRFQRRLEIDHPVRLRRAFPTAPALFPAPSATSPTTTSRAAATPKAPPTKAASRSTRTSAPTITFGFFYNRTRYDSNPGPSRTQRPAGAALERPGFRLRRLLYRFSYDWTISPRLFNHLAIGGNKFYKNSYSPNSGGNWKSKVCIPNAVDCNVNFPNISFTEFTGWGSTAYNGTEQPSWSLKDDLSYIRGSHTMKFGYAFESQRANGFGQQNISGQATFSFLETAVPGATTFTSGSSFASFLLGAADSGATETIRYLAADLRLSRLLRAGRLAVNKKLTVTYGLRYEFTLPPVAGGNQYTDFSPTTPNPAVNNYPGALIFAGSGAGRTGQSSLIPGWYGAWGPRLGLAYALEFEDHHPRRRAHARSAA